MEIPGRRNSLDAHRDQLMVAWHAHQAEKPPRTNCQKHGRNASEGDRSSPAEGKILGKVAAEANPAADVVAADKEKPVKSSQHASLRSCRYLS